MTLPVLPRGFKEIFPEGLDGFTNGRHSLFEVNQLQRWFVEHYNPETPPDSIVVKTVLYGKQTKGAQHEFIIIQVGDTSIPGLINYLVLQRDTYERLERYAISVASTPRALDKFQISYDGGIKRLLEECGLQPCNFLEQISFQSNTPLHLYELVTLASVVSEFYPWYTNSSRNMFVGEIWECIRLARPYAIHQDNLAEKRGESPRVRCLPHDPTVRKLYKMFMEKLSAVNIELQHLKEAHGSSLLGGQLSESLNLPQQAKTSIVPSEMSALQMFLFLVERGCADLSSRIYFNNSASAITGGSFGDIWQGKIDGRTKVAIKILRFQTIVERHKKGLKRVMRETYVWSKAIHPNVQPLMGIVIRQDRLGMVSRWMENGNLQQYVRNHPSANRYQLCCGVAAGVTYLHDAINMVHGDIKALNVLVSASGVPKLSDFDHSILSDSTLAFSATTNLGGGTLRWMAPELLLSSDEPGSLPATRTKQTDVYALGMTILEVITGEVPYSEYLNAMGIYRAIDKKKHPNRPQQLLGSNGGTDQMWKLLLKCWDYDPAARPGATAVQASLENVSIAGASTPFENNNSKFQNFIRFVFHLIKRHYTRAIRLAYACMLFLYAWEKYTKNDCGLYLKYGVLFLSWEMTILTDFSDAC